MLGRHKMDLSVKIIGLGLRKFPNRIAAVWDGGAAATVLLHMIREHQGGQLAIPVLFLDTGLHPKEIYEGANQLSQRWQLALVRATEKGTLRRYRQTKSKLVKKQLLELIKERAVIKAVKKKRLKALFLARLWEDEPANASEVYITHERKYSLVQPLLHLTTEDIREYIRSHELDDIAVYEPDDSRRNGKRFR